MINEKTDVVNINMTIGCYLLKYLPFTGIKLRACLIPKPKKVTVAQLLSFGYEFHLLCHYLLRPF